MVKIPTARGDEIDSAQLGFTLMVENLYNINTEVNLQWPETLGDPEERIDDVVSALENARAHGVDTIVDRTIPGLGRNVEMLKKTAERTKVNIILTTGFYTWRDLPLMFEFREQMKPMLEDKRSFEYFFEKDIEEGIGNSGVRAAVLKVATDKHGVTEGVEILLKATARVHRRTGVPIGTHTDGAHTGLLQMEAFRAEGVDLSRVYFGHICRTPGDDLGEIQQLLDTGATVGFDMLSMADVFGNRESRLARVVELCRRGYAGQILLSHDNQGFTDLTPEIDQKRHKAPYPRWCELSESFLPLLRENGVTDEQIDQMMIGNPRRIFESRALGAY
ncbi:phosphotriesterase family protein [Croceicoccus sediminis]|uniref:phosphotriesterase family protein n=1 Tax=Croceicoccus sediminis TaxID=2571150 RepID=UPI001478CE0C|nr:phosphotriesterase [Croceicoccus sediminis]